MNASLPGDLGMLANNMNSSFQQAESMIETLASGMRAITEGKTYEEWRDRNHQCSGEWQRILHSAANVLQEREALFKEINEVMSAVAQGNYQSQVSTNVQGIYLQLAQAINQTVSTLDKAISDVVLSAQHTAQGNLTTQIQRSYPGSLGELTQAINTSNAGLRTSFCQVANQAKEVAQSAAQVADSNGTLSHAIQEQAAALEETAAAMEEITAQVQQSADQASESRLLAEKTSQGVASGAQAMQESIAAMHGISEVSSKISGIVTLIDSIAFQTNLLALNAAVEAARAGEHGRGFAVVAGEVRALAGKSAEAAQDIKRLIDETTLRIQQGTEQVQHTGEVMSSIIDQVGQMSALIGEIATNAQEQAKGLAQMNDAVTAIDKTTQESAALVEENASLAEYLGEVAQALDGLVGRFELGNCAADSQMNHADSDHRQGRVLVVDDNMPNQKVACALMHKLGYATLTASNGREALQLAKEHQPDLILMDIEMPVMDGLSATRELRRSGFRQPIIAMTGHGKEMDAKAAEAGMNDILHKPLNPQQLAQAVAGRTNITPAALPSPMTRHS